MPLRKKGQVPGSQADFRKGEPKEADSEKGEGGSRWAFLSQEEATLQVSRAGRVQSASDPLLDTEEMAQMAEDGSPKWAPIWTPAS